MSQLLALEWNGSEARAAVASRHGGRTVIEQAFLVPLHSAPPEAGQPEPDAGQQIAEALAARGVGPIDAMVAVGRGSVELRQLQLPAAADADLPKMVRLQALLEFNELDENWLLDFVAVDDAGKGPRTVLAAAVAPALIERVQAVCQRGGLKMRHLVLRPCAAAALRARAQSGQKGQVQLLVELLNDQADLTVMVDGKVLFLRTTRFNGGPPGRQSLSAEIRLTMTAVQNQSGGRKVTKIALCGRGPADAALAQEIEKETGTRVEVFDPLAGLTLGPELRASPPEHPGRFAAVLGMLLAELDGAAPAIDFLHPRHAVAPANPRRKWGLAAAAAALLLAAYLVYGRLAYWRLEGEVGQLEAQSAAADKVLAHAGSANLATAGEIAKWEGSEVVWLERLRELNEDLPPAESVTIGRLLLTRLSDRPMGTRSSARAAAGGEMLGRMHIEGRARDNKAVTDLEQSLRAHARRVEGSKTKEDRSTPPYSVSFITTVLVGQESKK
jgi:Tfp pilus assembly PilM family ATPase